MWYRNIRKLSVGFLSLPLFIVVLMFAILLDKGIQASTPQPNAVTLNIKVTHRAASGKMVWVGDRHYVAMGKREGKAVFSNGEIAVYDNTAYVDADLGNRSSTFQVYTRFSFEDGSTISVKGFAKGFRDENNLPGAKGTGEIYHGTGRFNGIKGSVQFTNRQLQPTSKDPYRTAKIEAVMTYTLP